MTMALRKNVMLLLLGVCFADLPQDTTMHGAQDATNVNEKSVPTSAGHLRGSVLKTITTEQDSAIQGAVVKNATAETQTGVPLSLKKSGIPSGAAPSCPCGKRCTQTRRITAGQFACVRWECSKCLKMLVPEESQAGNALDGNAMSLMSLQNVEVENATAETKTGVPLSLKKSGIPSGLAPTRTSWSCMMRYAQDSVVERLEHRLLSIGCLPMENLERMNAVRYAPGEYFNKHHDGKFRPLTIFVYLNDLDEEDYAGDTYFPVLGLSFRPRQGTAVMWPNSVDGKEDPRVLHAGRAPTLGVKYGVNCFFNVNKMRHMMPDLKEYGLNESMECEVRKLGRQNSDEKLVAYQLCASPKLMAVKAFLSDEEVDHFMTLLEASTSSTAEVSSDTGPFCGGTQTLRVVQFEETELVKAIEARLVATGGLPLSHLAPLRIVRTASDRGLCNRCCGPKSVYICLSEQDEVFFYRLGLRLKLRKGDALLWPNVQWRDEDPIEDLRTVRVHLPAGPSDAHRAIGIDAFFHDHDIRHQRRQHNFQESRVPGASAEAEKTECAVFKLQR